MNSSLFFALDAGWAVAERLHLLWCNAPHVCAVGPAAEAEFKPTASQTVLLAVITGHKH